MNEPFPFPTHEWDFTYKPFLPTHERDEGDIIFLGITLIQTPATSHTDSSNLSARDDPSMSNSLERLREENERGKSGALLRSVLRELKMILRRKELASVD